MTRPVSAIRNLGPRSAEAFARAGLHSAEAVIALGADAAYARLIAAGTRPHFIGYYALVMSTQSSRKPAQGRRPCRRSRRRLTGSA